MRYAKSRYERDRADLAYRIYVTDTLRLLGEGKYRSDRFCERLKMAKRPIDRRPADEVAKDILAKAGIEVKHGISI